MGALDSSYQVSGGHGVFKMNFTNASIPFYGKIDNVQVYNRALGAAEERAHAGIRSLALS